MKRTAHSRALPFHFARDHRRERTINYGNFFWVNESLIVGEKCLHKSSDTIWKSIMSVPILFIKMTEY